MQAILLSSEEVAKRAYQIYEGGIRQKVEIEENIGKMVIINVETGDYEVDKTGIQAQNVDWFVTISFASKRCLSSFRLLNRAFWQRAIQHQEYNSYHYQCWNIPVHICLLRWVL